MRVSRPLLATGAFALLVLFGASCGGDDGGAPDEVSIAFLRAVMTADDDPQQSFIDELGRLGYVEGDNLTLVASDPSEVHAEPDDVERTVARWVEDGVDLIVALSSSGAMVAGETAGDIPVLFLSTDPTATGLVEDEREPEGNLTGATFRVPADRTLAVVAETLGGLDRIGCLYPEDDPAAGPSRLDIERGAASLDIEVTCVGFGEGGEAAAVEDVVHGADGEQVDAVVLANAPSTVRALPELEPALDAAGVAVVANTEVEFAVIVLQPDVDALYRQMARQAGQLLDGVAVAETPVEDPGEFELVVNLDVAERLGIRVPASVVERADRVIR